MMSMFLQLIAALREVMMTIALWWETWCQYIRNWLVTPKPKKKILRTVLSLILTTFSLMHTGWRGRLAHNLAGAGERGCQLQEGLVANICQVVMICFVPLLNEYWRFTFLTRAWHWKYYNLSNISNISSRGLTLGADTTDGGGPKKKCCWPHCWKMKVLLLTFEKLLFLLPKGYA